MCAIASNSLAIAIEVDLDKIVPAQQTLDVAIITVIRHKDG
jgi:hypothetical protein